MYLSWRDVGLDLIMVPVCYECREYGRPYDVLWDGKAYTCVQCDRKFAIIVTRQMQYLSEDEGKYRG